GTWGRRAAPWRCACRTTRPHWSCCAAPAPWPSPARTGTADPRRSACSTPPPSSAMRSRSTSTAGPRGSARAPPSWTPPSPRPRSCAREPSPRSRSSRWSATSSRRPSPRPPRRGAATRRPPRQSRPRPGPPGTRPRGRTPPGRRPTPPTPSPRAAPPRTRAPLCWTCPPSPPPTRPAPGRRGPPRRPLSTAAVSRPPAPGPNPPRVSTGGGARRGEHARVRIYLFLLLLAAAVTFLTTPAVRLLARRAGAMTAVRARDVHDAVTPRLGGLAMLAGVLCAMLVASNVPFLEGLFRDSRPPWAILAAGTLVCLLGAADDRWDLDWITKLAGQVLAALLLAWQGVSLVTLPINGVTVLSGRTALILTVLVVVVSMNAVNF